MPQPEQTYAITIAGLERHLPLVRVRPGLRIAVLNILGDTPLIEAAAESLAGRLPPREYHVLVTAEAKSIPLVHALSVATRRPYVVLRKSYKTYMGDALAAETRSITTGDPQRLYLDQKDRDAVRGRRVLLVDDVISTGSTLQGMRELMQKAGATIAGEAAILTEGDPADWDGIVSLGHLPLFRDEDPASA
ncbi:MAG TPA: phosphoribosyltransferase family protein [Gammaproteobacteria bacterium]|nr:phosphoribosyltransferase family protein [Gammaproteobacteria bacterium]